MHEGEKINKRLCKFFIEIFEFTDEQLAAIDCQIPMTQEIYDSILDRCMELGTATTRTVFITFLHSVYSIFFHFGYQSLTI